MLRWECCRASIALSTAVGVCSVLDHFYPITGTQLRTSKVLIANLSPLPPAVHYADALCSGIRRFAHVSSRRGCRCGTYKGCCIVRVASAKPGWSFPYIVQPVTGGSSSRGLSTVASSRTSSDVLSSPAAHRLWQYIIIGRTHARIRQGTAAGAMLSSPMPCEAQATPVNPIK